jgi:hypothetical protein
MAREPRTYRIAYSGTGQVGREDLTRKEAIRELSTERDGCARIQWRDVWAGDWFWCDAQGNPRSVV